MSLSFRQNEVARFAKSIAQLRTQDAAEAQKEAAKARDMNHAAEAVSRAANRNTMRSHQQKALRCSDELAKIQKRRSDIGRKIAIEMRRLHSAEQALRREEESERKKAELADKRRERERLDYLRRINRDMKTTSEQIHITSGPINRKTHDAFISHASEDKESFVRPLAEGLRAKGWDIWYDEFTLSVGDSLRRSIDAGLSASRYGIVIFSKHFFGKNWSQYELDGLVAKEIYGRKVILPIWHMVSKDQIMEYSPSMADKVALNSSLLSIEEIVDELSKVLVPGGPCGAGSLEEVDP